MTDWYRKTSWTKTDEEEYFAKLNRARKISRPQYLKLQASALAGTRRPELLDAAESLIKKLFADFPDDKFNRGESLELLGEIYQCRGRIDEAMSYYKKAIDYEKDYPQVQGPAFLYFSDLAVKLNKYDLFPFVEALLTQRVDTYPFPYYKYKIYGLLSVISKSNGNREKAAQFADLANKFANLETSGFRYHPTYGVVVVRDAKLDDLMMEE